MKCKFVINTTKEPVIPKFEDFETEIDNSQIPLIGDFIWMLMEDNSMYKIYPYRDETEYIGILKPSIKPSSLTFNTLRKANVTRLPEFKNSKGLPAHSKEDGSDWSSAQWLQAVIGELGEYANVMKKVERGDLTFEEAKPSIEKELADVMTYLDILAFRVGVDLAKVTENKFNEVSERVGCSLRIENNEVVRKKKEIKAEEFKLPVTTTNKELQIKEGGCGTSIFENYDYNPKNGEFTPTKEFVEKLQTEQKFWNNRYGLSRQELFIKKSFASDIGGVLNGMIRWKLFRNYAEIYPLKILRNTIDDVYSFEFQGIDNGKQYLFYHAKRIFIRKDNMTLRVIAIAQSNIFDFFSKQLGTKIVGMLINGRKENTKLNPGDFIQFYDDRNVLYNFRLVKSSDENVEISAT